MSLHRLPKALALLLAVGCSGAASRPMQTPGQTAGERVLTILATNDLHGALDGVLAPETAGREGVLGGFDRVAGLLGRLRSEAGGAVLVADVGDCFQGDLAVNRQEGMPCTEFFNAAGYDVRTIGNHEFDHAGCGPEKAGEAVPDPTCALRAALARSRQPVVVANVRREQDGQRVDWPGVRPGVVLDVQGIRVGVVGVVTRSTPFVSNREGSRGLLFTDPVKEAREAVDEVRRQGATVVVLLAHVNGQCGRGAAMPGPGDRGCRLNGELRALQEGLQGQVDLILAGHAHAWLVGEKGPIPVLETPGQGTFLARARIRVDGQGRVVPGGVEALPLVPVCPEERPESRVCHPGWAGYSGPAPSDPGVAALMARWKETVAEECREVVAVAQEDVFHRRGIESPMANLAADLMREASGPWDHGDSAGPADIAFVNAGGTRDSLRKGEVTRCDLHRIWPFEDPIVEVRMTGEEVQRLAEMWVREVRKIPAVSGVRVQVYSGGRVVLRDLSGRPLEPGRWYRVVTSAYLVRGGDRMNAFFETLPADRFRVLGDGEPLREAIIRVLRRKGRIVAPEVGRIEGFH